MEKKRTQGPATPAADAVEPQAPGRKRVQKAIAPPPAPQHNRRRPRRTPAPQMDVGSWPSETEIIAAIDQFLAAQQTPGSAAVAKWVGMEHVARLIERGFQPHIDTSEDGVAVLTGTVVTTRSFDVDPPEPSIRPQDRFLVQCEVVVTVRSAVWG